MYHINIDVGLDQVIDHWRPKIIAEFNGQQIKLAKFKGEFVWHRHDDTDEVFLVWRGRFRMEYRDRSVELGPGDLVTVPRGVEHRPVAGEEVEVILLEARETSNTGNVIDAELTAPPSERL
jgi:mannose-6-phosphate isomerase-like protein (cupin superfamily)